MADQQTIEELIEYYVNLLIIQYHNKPKARATIEALAEVLLANGIMFDVRDGFNLETAVGAQLDIIGKYAGIDRFYEGQDLSGYFSFIEYDEVDTPPPDRIGFTDYTEFETKVGRFLVYPDVLGIGLELDDEAFRVIIKLRIVQNHSDHSHKSIDDGIYKFFGDTVHADSDGNMVMTYFIPRDLTNILQVAIQKEVLPRPMAVWLNYIIPQDRPFFGFAEYPEHGFHYFLADASLKYFGNSSMIADILNDPTLAATPGNISFRLAFDSGIHDGTNNRYVINSGRNNTSVTGIRALRTATALAVTFCTQTYEYALNLTLADYTPYDLGFIADSTGLYIYDIPTGTLLASTTTQTPRTATPQANFRVGQAYNSAAATTSYNAGIFFLAVWDGIKTVEQMKNIDEANLYHLYRFDVSASATVVDEGSAGKDITGANGALTTEGTQAFVDVYANGYDLDLSYSPLIEGFTTYAEYDSKIGQMLAYDNLIN